MRICASLLVAALFAAACAAEEEDQADALSDEPYRVVMTTATSGPVALFSDQYVQGIEAAAQVINEDGGILGREVLIETIDTGGDPGRGVPLLQRRFASGEPVDFVSPGISSTETLATLPVTTRNEIFTCSPNAADDMNDPEMFPFHFGVSLSAHSNVQGLLGELLKEDYQSVGLIHPENAYGEAIAESFEEGAADAGIDLATSSFDPEKVNLTPELERLQSRNPDVLISGGPIAAQVGYVLEARQTLGWDVPVLGDLSVATAPLPDLVEPRAWQGVTSQVYQIQKYKPTSESFDRFLEAVKEQGEISGPIYIAGLLWDCLHLAKAAAEQAGSTDADEVSRALEDLEEPADPPWVVYPSYTYSEESHFPAFSPDLFDYVPYTGELRDGMLVVD